MMKAPAFQFYADDFLAGTYDMSQAEVGAYIRLLCIQWNRGSIPVQPEKLERLAGGSVSADVLSKFVKNGDSLLNLRLESERAKQARFIDLQRKKGLASGRSRAGSTSAEPESNHSSASVTTDVQPNVNSPSPSPSPEDIEYVRIFAGRTEHSVQRPSLDEVLIHADRIGLAAWRAEDWFNEMEGGGWIDHQHRPIDKWQPILSRVKTKWESDGRPNGPPRSRQSSQDRATEKTLSQKIAEAL